MLSSCFLQIHAVYGESDTSAGDEMIAEYFRAETAKLESRCLADINPLRYLIRIIREIFLKGNDITYFINDLLIMSGITALILSLSLFNFKRMVSK
jgi:ABC-type polysaccharide/polyol phosphate export permease